MRDLHIYSIPLEKVSLERIDPNNKEHKKAISRMRDATARKMMYDVKQDLIHAKKNIEMGNTFLLKDNNQYIGYIYISNLHDDSRTISMMIEKSVRNKGYGKIVLNSVSEYLFREKLADSLVVYIKDKNQSSINMAQACGFEKQEQLNSTNNTSKYRRSK